MRQSLPLVLVLLFTPFVASAQHAGAPAMPPVAVHSIAAAPAAPALHVAPAVGVAPVHGSPRTVTGGRTVPGPAPRSAMHPASSSKRAVNPRPVRSTPIFSGTPVAQDDLGVPGLGFDYVHYAAVHPNAGRHHFGGGVAPFVDGGIYVPYPVYMEGGAAAEPAAESTPTEAEQPAEEAAARPEAVTARPHAHSSAPSEPDSEYVFVRRDGTVFFAVAFTFDSTDLRYITQEGFRKSIPLASLDLAATQQFNEQRGLSPRLPS